MSSPKEETLPLVLAKKEVNPYPDQNKGKDVYLQGSRQMDSLSRQYYERNLGAGMFVSPETENGLTGYSEPLRRFNQHEGFTPQINEIANAMPSRSPAKTTTRTSRRVVVPTPRSTRATLACLEPATLPSIPSSKASILKTIPTSPS